VRIVAARGDWSGLIPDFTNAVQTLSDGELDRLIRAIFPAVEKADKRALVSQWAELVVTRGQSRSNLTSSVATAARFWAENVLATDKGGLPACLNTLLRAQVQANTVADLFRRHYYEFTENTVAMKQLTAIGERLALRVDTGDLRDDIRGKVLDGCFLLRDYDRALSLLEAGMAGHDPQWHVTAIVKVKAHRALERNEPREAVKYFRDFMQCLRDSKDSGVPDPVTHLVFTKEMVLGRNAKRIGDILAGIPDRAEAAKAYAEARALYAQAMKDTPEPAARKVIEAEIAQLPTGQ
jgi:tetratricopeptide (TPR) repeat protein